MRFGSVNSGNSTSGYAVLFGFLIVIVLLCFWVAAASKAIDIGYKFAVHQEWIKPLPEGGLK